MREEKGGMPVPIFVARAFSKTQAVILAPLLPIHDSVNVASICVLYNLTIAVRVIEWREKENVAM